MTYKDELLEKLRRNTHEQYPMPNTPIDGISYDDTVKQFVDMSMSVGSKVVMAKPNEKLDDIVRTPIRRQRPSPLTSQNSPSPPSILTPWQRRRTLTAPT